MVPLSFNKTSRDLIAEAIRSLPTTDIAAVETQESFESHLNVAPPRETTTSTNNDSTHPTSEPASDPTTVRDADQGPAAKQDAENSSEPQDADSSKASEEAPEREPAPEQEHPEEGTSDDTQVVVAEVVGVADADTATAETQEPHTPSMADTASGKTLASEEPQATAPKAIDDVAAAGEATEPEAEADASGAQATPHPSAAARQSSVSDPAQGDAAKDSLSQATEGQPQEETAGTVQEEGATRRKSAKQSKPPAGTPAAAQPVANEDSAPPEPLTSALRPPAAESQPEGRRDSPHAPAPATLKETDANAASGQRFAQHLVAQHGERAAKGLELNSADQARFVDRVARAFRAAEGRNGVVRLRLSPPELGSLRLEIKVQGGALAARLEADTPQARSLLMDNLPVLRERLADQGIRIEQFDVELLDRQSSGDFDGWDQHRQHQTDKSGQSEATNQSPDTPEEGAFPEHPGKRPGEDEQLNVVI
jgi:flagellar hook-length control protein FliK